MSGSEWSREPRRSQPRVGRLRATGRKARHEGQHAREVERFPGSEFSRMGAPKGRQTSREVARRQADPRRSGRLRAGAENRSLRENARSREEPSRPIPRSGQPSLGTRHGPAQAKDEGGAVKPTERLPTVVRYSEDQHNSARGRVERAGSGRCHTSVRCQPLAVNDTGDRSSRYLRRGTTRTQSFV